MGQEVADITTLEQVTGIDQLLTPEGRNLQHTPFIQEGRGKSERGFFGREKVVKEVRERLQVEGIAVIEGSRRSGKSTLSQVIADGALRDDQVQAEIHYSLQGHPDETPEGVINGIRKAISRRLTGQDGQVALITVDEIEAYEPGNQISFLEAIDELRKQGHKIVIVVDGNLYGDSPEELPRVTKDKLLGMAADRPIVVNGLLDDKGMRDLLSHGDKPIFTELLTKFLIAEAGGHPYFGNVLANSAFGLLKFGEIEPSRFAEKFNTKIRDSEVLDNFGVVVDKIVAAGFNPITWEWSGTGEKPDVEFYRNSIPGFTSTIFRDWLTDYVRKNTEQ